MLGFVGQFQHTLDEKGRLILPAKFRSEFERGGALSPDDEGCVALWTPGEYNRQQDEYVQRRRVGGAKGRRETRYWASKTSEVDFDKQGRFALSSTLREFAQLSGDVLIVGAIDHVELWNPTVFAEMVEPAEANFKQGLDE